MTIIDFHTHIYPPKIAQKATESTCAFYDLKTDLVGTADVLLEEGRRAGVSKYVLLPVVVKPEQTHHINQFVAKEIKSHSEFYGFGALHALTENPLEEIQYIETAGLKGIKLHPDIQDYPIDDLRLFPVFDYLQDRLPVLIHCGDPRHNNSHPRRLKKIIDEFPHLQIIAAHLGGWSMFDTAVQYLKDAECYFDLSSCFQFLPRDRMKKYIDSYGADRILFGTDFPLWNPQKEVEAFMKLDLSPVEQEKIACQNALRILKGV